MRWLCLLLLSATTAFADMTGMVVAISDGDTITVLVDQRQVKVRLADIDSPEAKQPFGSRSKQSLSDICYRKKASIQDRGTDRYGRTIGTVICDGVDANAEQVRRGMAWVYVRYAPKNSPLFKIEENARNQKTGLWSLVSPTPPWEWRRTK